MTAEAATGCVALYTVTCFWRLCHSNLFRELLHRTVSLVEKCNSGISVQGVGLFLP